MERAMAGWDLIDDQEARESDPPAGRLARMRRKVDQLLAGMLSDDADPADLPEAEPAGR
jgi:hypothetical protein